MYIIFYSILYSLIFELYSVPCAHERYIALLMQPHRKKIILHAIAAKRPRMKAAHTTSRNSRIARRYLLERMYTCNSTGSSLLLSGSDG